MGISDYLKGWSKTDSSLFCANTPVTPFKLWQRNVLYNKSVFNGQEIVKNTKKHNFISLKLIFGANENGFASKKVIIGTKYAICRGFSS